MSTIRLTYFDLEGGAEKVRLVFVVTGKEFEDKRISFDEWEPLKPKTPYGQLPVLEITSDDGSVKTFAQSDAMMRWAARKFDSDGALYPSDPDAMLQVEEVIGLANDLQRAWTPCLYIAMGRHTAYGHPAEWPEKDAVIKRMREDFLAAELPKFMGFFTRKLEATGAFFCGAHPTIADLQLLAQLRYFTKGTAEHVPADCLDKYTAVTNWMARMYAIPQIKKWYKLQ